MEVTEGATRRPRPEGAKTTGWAEHPGVADVLHVAKKKRIWSLTGEFFW